VIVFPRKSSVKFVRIKSRYLFPFSCKYLPTFTFKQSPIASRKFDSVFLDYLREAQLIVFKADVVHLPDNLQLFECQLRPRLCFGRHSQCLPFRLESRNDRNSDRHERLPPPRLVPTASRNKFPVDRKKHLLLIN